MHILLFFGLESEDVMIEGEGGSQEGGAKLWAEAQRGGLTTPISGDPLRKYLPEFTLRMEWGHAVTYRYSRLDE